MDSTDTSDLNSDYGWQEKQHEHLKLYLLNKFYQLKPLPVVCRIWIASPFQNPAISNNGRKGKNR